MIKVFAYGSNLCIERLRARTPSARVVAVAAAGGHSLRWHKRCADGSAKCDAFATDAGADELWGVVYEMTPADKTALDRFEGLGKDYFEKVVRVTTRDGGAHEAVAYTANPELITPGLRPFHWYKGFVTTGASQHDFPIAYRRILDAVEAQDDANAARHARESAILESARRRIARA
jgi:gamma-glutamylcyclotransferase